MRRDNGMRPMSRQFGCAKGCSERLRVGRLNEVYLSHFRVVVLAARINRGDSRGRGASPSTKDLQPQCTHYIGSLLFTPGRLMKLSHYTQGRDNNFNLIRIAAALAVLLVHSFPIALGSR